VTSPCVTSVTSASASASSSSSSLNSSSLKKGKINKKGEGSRIRLVLDDGPKRWEGITEGDRALWAATYPGCNVDQVLQEMIAYWDAQPPAKRKLNWKRTIVNRLKWLQDHGGSRSAGQAPEDAWIKSRRLAGKGPEDD